MNRRFFVTAVAATFGLMGLATQARSDERVPVVGLLMPSIGQDHLLLDILRKRLQELGYVNGQSIRYEFRGAQGDVSRLPHLARELVQLKVDVILAATEPAIWAAKNATASIPIVMIAYTSDPAASGLVDSFGRPGGNLTGIFTRESEMLGKRLEVLKETVPGLSRLAVFWDAFSTPSEREQLVKAAHALNIRLDLIELREPYNIAAAFGAAKKRKVEAVMTLLSPPLYVRNAQIAKKALLHRLPLMSSAHDFTRAGGLITYGTDVRDNYYRVAYFIDEVLKGKKPSELPIDQVAIVKLVVNLKTAQALGLTVPPSVLARADEVIQ